MSESNLGSKWIQQGSISDPSDFVAVAIKRYRVRVKLLATGTIVLWVAAVLVIPAFFMPAIGLMEQQMHDLEQNPARVTPQDLVESMHFVLGRVSVAAAWMMVVSLLTSLFAAICTIWLVLTVRRVTLEQVSAGLTQISEQLKTLQKQA